MLEKILEEIEKQKRCCLMIGYAKEYNQGALKMAEVIENIIRKHMDDDKCGKCSRRKWYLKGYEDGKKYKEEEEPVASEEFLRECK